MTLLRRLALTVTVLAAAYALGALLCLLKGDGGGITMALGNLSAPYVIIAVCAGLTMPLWWLGALAGIAATEATVSGFYGTWATVLGHEVSHSAITLWGGAGIASGALFGAIESAARTRPGLRYVLPGLLLLEPIATQVGFVITSPLWGIGYAGQLNPRELFACPLELMVGVVAFALVRRHLHARRRKSGLHNTV